MIGFGFTSDWLRKWREIFKPITTRSVKSEICSNAKPMQTRITFDTQVKTPLQETLTLPFTHSIGLQVSIVGLERALYAYVKDASHTAPFDLKTVPLATTPMQDQVVKPGKTGISTLLSVLLF